MKKFLILSTFFVALATFSFGQMAGGPHDFGGTGWAAGIAATEICFVCHSAHNNVNAATELLWNQTITTETFTMYSNPSTITGAIDAQPGASSKLCLSCHDGITAMGSGGDIGTEFPLRPEIDLGTDLSKSHPISILYDEATDLGLNAKASLTNVKLYLDKVECASCHDAHETATSLLRVANTSSALCLECHNK